LANASDLEKIIVREEVEDSKPELIWQDVEEERLLVASNLEFHFEFEIFNSLGGGKEGRFMQLNKAR
jgi:hypothetical protein